MKEKQQKRYNKMELSKKIEKVAKYILEESSQPLTDIEYLIEGMYKNKSNCIEGDWGEVIK